MRPELKQTKAGIYKASNVSFDPKAMEAKSYDWWLFVTKVNGLTVFNDYSYSNTTRRHQWKVKALMQSLGLPIHIRVEMRESLDHPKAKAFLDQYLKNEKGAA